MPVRRHAVRMERGTQGLRNDPYTLHEAHPIPPQKETLDTNALEARIG
jgi:hypothetical protein